MSGILGYVQTSGPRMEADRFERMLGAMQHRGPDGRGVWSHADVILGHQMLRTVPEASYEQLPWHHEESSCVITSDARIDNRQELIEELGRQCFKTEIIPDSAIILQSYLRWGSECVHHLLGDFAFAIYDLKRQKLFCGRDFLGVKPFNYCYVNGTFLFCSEARPIAHHSGLPIHINEARIADSLTPDLEGYDTVSTFYQEIYRLPPAHTLELYDCNVRIRRYWNPEPPKTISYKTDDEYREALTEILLRSVVARCRGDKDPAILQSGGVDSAALMGLMREYCQKESGGTVQTYSGISKDVAGCKESRLITLLSDGEDIEPHLYTVDDLCENTDSVYERVSQLGEPFDIIMVLHFFLYSQAANDGKKFVLDGVDGDLAASLSLNYPVQLLRQCTFWAALRESYLQNRDFFGGTFSPFRQLAKDFISAFAPQFIKDYRWKRRLPGSIDDSIEQSMITRSFAGKVCMEKRLLEFEENQRNSNLSFPHEMYLKRVQNIFLTVALERYNRVASLCSIEPRHPLLDRRVIDFYMNLPWTQFMRNGWPKFLYRKVAEQFVPHEVCWRTGKEHVGWKFTEKMMQLKEDKIFEHIHLQCDKLKEIVKNEFLGRGSKKIACKEKSKGSVLRSDVAGLALWLNKK